MKEHVEVVEKSTALMVAGLRAMGQGEWCIAIEQFRAAAELRESLPWASDDESAWMLAAAWLNHGDALSRTGDSAVLSEALDSFNRAIEVMDHVDLEIHPSRPERLILCRINRAGTYCERGEISQSLNEYEEAQRLMDYWGEGVTAERCFLAAMMKINHSRALLRFGKPFEAWKHVKEGLVRLNSLSLTNETAAAGIQGRSIQCHALAMLLDKPSGVEKVGDWIAEATDSAEEALTLVKQTGFRDTWVADLVRYGAHIYRRCQPHFLGEFLIEWLGKDGPLGDDHTLKEEMKVVLWNTLHETARRVLDIPQDTEFVERQTRVVKSLQRGLYALS